MSLSCLSGWKWFQRGGPGPGCGITADALARSRRPAAAPSQGQSELSDRGAALGCPVTPHGSLAPAREPHTPVLPGHTSGLELAPAALGVGAPGAHEQAGAAVGPAGPARPRPSSLPPRTPRAMLQPRGRLRSPRSYPPPPIQAWLRLSPVGDSHREREEEEATRTDLDSVTGTRESHCSRTESEVPGRWPWWLARLQVAPLRVGLAQRLPLSLSEGPTGAG